MSFLNKYCALVLIVVVFSTCLLVETRSYNNGLIFYDLATKQAFLPPTVSVSRGRGLANIKFSEKGSIWSTFGKPCDCAGPLCGCCVGIKVKQYNFDQKMCANVSYVHPKEEINLEVFLNEKQSAKYAVSARNPSPFCIPVMIGVPMSMCVQLSNVGLQGDNMNACMDYMVQLASTQLFEMHFQCMQMGAQGVQWVGPGGDPVIPPSQSKVQDRSENVSGDYYDEEEQNEIGIAASEQGSEVSVKLEEDENKAQEELDFDDITDKVTEDSYEGEQEDIKDNEVVLSEEKEQQIVKDHLLLMNDELVSNEDSSELANSGEIPEEKTEANNNESDYNKSIEITTEPIEMEMTMEQHDEHVVSMDNIKSTIATTTMANNNIDNIDNALTTATIMTTTTSTTKTPTLTAPKTTSTMANSASTATASTFIENNDSDNGQTNDSDYGDEESDEVDDGTEEEEEEEDDEEENGDEEEDSEELEEPVNKNEDTPHATSTNDSVSNENANASAASHSQDQHGDAEDEGEEDNSENEEEKEENYEEIESATTTHSNESQLINNDFIAATVLSATAETPEDIVEKTAHKTDEQHTSINSNNPQLSTTDAMLSTSDSNNKSSSSNSNTIISNSSKSGASATVANNVNMSEITAATVTPLTRARKLLPLRQQNHSQQQPKWQYQQLHHQHPQQLHHRHARHHDA